MNIFNYNFHYFIFSGENGLKDMFETKIIMIMIIVIISVILIHEIE